MWLTVAAFTVGSTFGLSLPSCEGILTTFNPGGTIFSNISQTEILSLFADVPDWSADPSCSIPYYGIYNSDTAGTCSTTMVYQSGNNPEGEQ